MASHSDIMMDTDKENESSQEGITVAIRMRPLNKAEGDKQRIWKVLKKYNSVAQTTKGGKPLSERATGRNFFTFDKTFGEEDDTLQVYDSVAKGIVSSAVNGLNGTIFAYGQTSSGKTFTMQGSGSIEEGASSTGGGVVHMAARDIFSHIQSQPNRMFLVRASFLEIYNEEVRDLLSSTGNNLQVREDPRRGVFVQSQEEIVTDFQSLLKILFHGEKSRAVASTGMNERSSRSHTIFRITIESREKEENEGNDDEYSESGGCGAVRVSTLNLVDLAGSESVRHTGATGDRQKEGGMINQSLLTLSRVIVALGQPNQMHINFRDSKLTRILQPSLSGNARMAVICCATPSELYLEETRSTLQFASRAKLVKTNAQVNEVLDDRSIIRKLQRELAEARGDKTGPGTEHLRALENKAASAGTAAMEAHEKLNRLKASILNASVLFGGNGVAVGSDIAVGEEIQQPYQNLRSRKRRQSDGGALHSSRSTPLKANGNLVSSPKTAPRKKKEKTYHPVLSPSAEMTILRQALSTRNALSRSLKETLEKNSKIIDAKEDELKNVISENDGLAEEKEHAYTELSKVQDTLTSVQANLDATISEYDTLLMEKENVILEAFQKVEAENMKVTGLEDNNAKLLEQLDALQQKFDSLQEERVRSAFELAQSTEEKEKLQAERDKDQQALHEMNQRMGVLTTASNDAEKALHKSEETIRDLQEQLSTMHEEKNAAVERATVLETDLLKLREDSEEEQRVSQMFKEEIEADLESVVEERNAAQARTSELEETLQKTEEELASMQQKSSELSSKQEQECEVLQAAISDLEDKLETTVAEKNDVLERASALEDDLRDYEEKLECANKTVSEIEIAASTERDRVDKMVEDFQEKLEATATEKAQALARIEELESDLQQVKADLAAAIEKESSTWEKAQVESKNHEVTIQELRGQLDTIAAEKSEALNQSSDLRKQFAESEVAILDLREQLETTVTEKADTLTLLSSLKNELEASHASACDLCETVRELEHKLRQGEMDLSHSQSTESSLAAQCEALQLEHANLYQEVEQLVQENTELETFLSQSQEQNDRRVSEIQEQLELTISEKAEALDRLEALEVRLQEVHADLDAALARASTALEIAEEGSKTQEGTIQELREQLDAIAAEKSDALERASDLENQYAEAEIAIQSLREQLETTSVEKGEALIQLSSLQDELEEENDHRILELQEQLDITTAEKADMLDRLESLQADLERVQTDFDAALVKEATATEMAEAESKNNASTIQVLREQLDVISAEKSDALERGSDLAKQVIEAEIALQSLKQQLETITSEKSDALSQLSSQKDEFEAEYHRQISELQELLEASSSEKSAALDRLESLEAKCRELEDALASALAKESATLEMAEEEGKNHECTVRELREQLDAITAEKRVALEHSSELEKECEEAGIAIQDLQEKLEITTAEKADALHQLSSLQDKLEAVEASACELRESQAVLECRYTALEKANASITAESDELLSLKAEYDTKDEDLRTRLELTTQELETCEANVSLLKAEKEAFEELIEKLQSQSSSHQAALEKELGDLQSLYDDSDRTLKQCQVDLESAISARDSALSTLRDREEERDEAVSALEALYQKNRELSQNHLHSLSNEKEIGFQKEICELKQTNMELTQLLASSTGSLNHLKGRVATLESELTAKNRELEDSQYRLSQLEEELAYEEKLAMNPAEHVANQHEALLQEIESLQKTIDLQKSERRAVEESLKRQMGEEQRMLLQEGEKMMESLRSKALELEQRLSESEQEAYLCRQQLVEKTSGSDSLSNEVMQLKAKIKEKDQRIKKLQTFKLTKEFAEEHKQLKKDNKSLREELSRLQKELVRLQSDLMSSDSDSGLRTEISELRFDKEALEKKLRKFAAHCQRLEDDKAGMASALRSCNIDPSDFDDDIKEAVISLCDKMTSLDENGSVRSRRSSNGSEKPEAENMALRLKLERLSASEEKLNSKIAKYQKEIEDLRKESTGEQGETGRKLRYLEQENLQLMLDVKTTKKQLQVAREEIEVLRMNAMDNSTLDFGTVDLGSDSSQLSKVVKSSQPQEQPKKVTKTPLQDKTNGSSKENNGHDRNDLKRPVGRLPKVVGKNGPRAPGLGEAAVQGDETGECNQS